MHHDLVVMVSYLVIVVGYIVLACGAWKAWDIIQGRRIDRAWKAQMERDKPEHCRKAIERLEAEVIKPLIVEGETLLEGFEWTPVLAAMTDDEFDQHVSAQLRA